MSALRFSDHPAWVRMEGAGAGAVGITHFAQQQLGEIVSIALPQIGCNVEKGEEAAVIETVKVAAGFSSPISGTEIEVNGSLEAEPRIVNEDPTGEGWFCGLRLDDPGELDTLMDEATYMEKIGALG